MLGGEYIYSTWLITSKLANQRAPKALFTCVVYTNDDYDYVPQVGLLNPECIKFFFFGNGGS